MKIYAPVEDANGIYASVMFVNGVGETDNPSLIEWFKEHGYEVENIKSSIYDVTKTINEQKQFENDNLAFESFDEPEFESMTPNDLRDWMREHGYGSKIKNTRNKEKLLAILRGD